MAIDFSSILDAKSGEVKKPKVLPVSDNYQGVIKGIPQLIEAKDKEYTVIIRIPLGLTAWPDDVPEEDRLQEVKDGEFAPIDLSKRTLRRDYYNHRMFDLDQLYADLGIDASGRSHKEIFPELVGLPCTVEIGQYINSRSGEIGNQVNNLRSPQ